MVSSAARNRHEAARPYTMRHTFISIGLSNNANIKWIAEYTGTSLTMIEKHYGKYVNNDIDDQLARVSGSKSETFSETLDDREEKPQGQFSENASGGAALARKESWWAHLDSNYFEGTGGNRQKRLKLLKNK